MRVSVRVVQPRTTSQSLRDVIFSFPVKHKRLASPPARPPLNMHPSFTRSPNTHRHSHNRVSCQVRIRHLVAPLQLGHVGTQQREACTHPAGFFLQQHCRELSRPCACVRACFQPLPARLARFPSESFKSCEGEKKRHGELGQQMQMASSETRKTLRISEDAACPRLCTWRLLSQHLHV